MRHDTRKRKKGKTKTHSRMAENSGDENRRPARPVKDLTGLLKFCMRNTADEDAPTANREMSPERKEWLRQVLDEMSADPVEEVKRHLTTVGVYLGSQHPPDQARCNALQSLEQLQDWCESLDIAMDFQKIGGFSILHELLTHSESEFRLQGFQLVGVLMQNNSYCQECAIREDLLPTMLQVLESEQDPEVQCQALQAISCLVRDSDVAEGQQQFVAHQGFEVLKKVLQSPGLFKRVVKIAFFLSSICRAHPQYKDLVQEAGVVELLVQEVKGEHQQSHEHIMAALLSLASNHPPTQRLLAQPDLRLTSFLQDRIELLTNREENEEERAYAEELLQTIQSPASS